jgi:hypothetical protein
MCRIASMLVPVVICAPACLAAEAPPRPQMCSVAGDTDPVRRAIEAQYLKLAGAVAGKNMEALEALYSPTAGVITPTGQRFSREEALRNQRAALGLVLRTQHISDTILHLKLCGDEAVATVLVRWERDQRVAGAVVHVESNTMQDEHWRREEGVWKRGLIEKMVNGVVFADGKRFNLATASNGYDPEAPEYNPDDPHPKRGALEALLPLASEKGAQAAIDRYEDLKGSSDYYVSEYQISLLGYRLLEMKKVADAVLIFAFNTRIHPASANAWDSLGEGYLAAGDTGRAAEAYSRSLKLDSGNDNAAAALARLRTR